MVGASVWTWQELQPSDLASISAPICRCGAARAHQGIVALTGFSLSAAGSTGLRAKAPGRQQRKARRRRREQYGGRLAHQ
jgi:hypothetical protein